MYLALAAASLLIVSGSAMPEPLTETLESPPEPARPERQEVPVSTLDLELSGGFPLHVAAILRGELPDGCSVVESVEQRFSPAARSYRLAVASVRQATSLCDQVLTPFEVRVPLIEAGLATGEFLVESGGATARFEVPSFDESPIFGAPAPEESLRICLVGPSLCFSPPSEWRRDGLAPIWESPSFLSARLGVRWRAEPLADPVGRLPEGAEIHEQTAARMGAAAGVRFAVHRERCWSEHLFVGCGPRFECELWLEAPSEPLLDAAGEAFWRLVRFAIRY